MATGCRVPKVSESGLACWGNFRHQRLGGPAALRIVENGRSRRWSRGAHGGRLRRATTWPSRAGRVCRWGWGRGYNSVFGRLRGLGLSLWWRLTCQCVAVDHSGSLGFLCFRVWRQLRLNIQWLWWTWVLVDPAGGRGARRGGRHGNRGADVLTTRCDDIEVGRIHQHSAAPDTGFNLETTNFFASRRPTAATARLHDMALGRGIGAFTAGIITEEAHPDVRVVPRRVMVAHAFVVLHVLLGISVCLSDCGQRGGHVHRYGSRWNRFYGG